MLSKKSPTRLQRSQRKFNRKLLLPFLLFIFFIFIVGRIGIKKLNLNLTFELPTSQTMVNPIPSLSEKSSLEGLLREHGFSLTGLSFGEKDAQASLSGNLTVFFSLEKDFLVQVNSLQFILSRTKIENKQPKIVDLRYTKPLLSY